MISQQCRFFQFKEGNIICSIRAVIAGMDVFLCNGYSLLLWFSFILPVMLTQDNNVSKVFTNKYNVGTVCGGEDPVGGQKRSSTIMLINFTLLQLIMILL